MQKHTVLLLLIFATSFAGCGVKIKSDPIRVDPIRVEHRIILDTAELYKLFQADCKAAAVDPLDTAEINACADTKLNDFIEKFTHLG